MIIDLSRPIESDMQVFPGGREVKIETVSDYSFVDWHVDVLHLSNHAGTHIDAPFHHIPNGKRINDFPLEKFIGAGVVLNMTDKKPLEYIEKKDLYIYDEMLEKLEIVILRTGWEKYYGTKEYENHPYLSTEAAEYIAQKKISIVGVDAFSLDSTALNTDYVHSILLGDETLMVENLMNLDKLPLGQKCIFAFLPLATKNTDGSPVRAVCFA